MHYPSGIVLPLMNNSQQEYPKCEIKNPCIKKKIHDQLFFRAPEKCSMFIIGFLLAMEFRAVVTECSLPPA